jgi:hypothetical protein
VDAIQRRKLLAHALLNPGIGGTSAREKGARMARKKLPAHPARDRSRDDESLMLRSAESLGRMIGSLQRQLEAATGRVIDEKPNGAGARKPARAKSGGVKTGSGATSRGGARKKSASATNNRKTSRSRAKKTAKKR